MMPDFVLAIALTLVAGANLAVAFPSFKVPTAIKSTLKSSFCEYPDEFVVKNFQVWTPDAGNNRSTRIDFQYSDQTTFLNTYCHLNDTSGDTGTQGKPARHACEDSWIHFTWQDGTLTIIERVCPLEDHRSKVEATGSVAPNLHCDATSTRNSSAGDGKACAAAPRVSALFTTLGPEPS